MVHIHHPSGYFGVSTDFAQAVKFLQENTGMFDADEMINTAFVLVDYVSRETRWAIIRREIIIDMD